MLYVLGRLPLPERHPAGLRWRIFEALTVESEAAVAMASWLNIVEHESRGLDASSALEQLVAKMVVREPTARVGLDALVEEAAALLRDI
jgi:hypothetical protein